MRKEIPAALRSAFILCLIGYSAHGEKTRLTIVSGGKQIRIDEHCTSASLSTRAAAIFLHGSGGPQSRNLPYLDDADDLAKQGYCVYLLHYLDATNGSAEKPKDRYPIWVQAVVDTAKYITDGKRIPIGRIALVGYSLGASIALASAATKPRFGAIVDFSGSLPDDYVHLFEAAPPLLILHGQDDAVIPVTNAEQLSRICAMKRQVCQIQLFPGEGHFLSSSAVLKAKHEMEHFLSKHIPDPDGGSGR